MNELQILGNFVYGALAILVSALVVSNFGNLPSNENIISIVILLLIFDLFLYSKIYHYPFSKNVYIALLSLLIVMEFSLQLWIMGLFLYEVLAFTLAMAMLILISFLFMLSDRLAYLIGVFLSVLFAYLILVIYAGFILFIPFIVLEGLLVWKIFPQAISRTCSCLGFSHPRKGH